MNKYTLSILGAGCLWGFMGMFTRHLTGYGFSTQAAVIARCGFASLCFGILLLVRDKKLFRIHLRDIWCFLGLGLCSLLFFTYCYFQCIALTSLSMAAVLLYTAPGIVMLISLFLFREKLTVRKILALVLAFAGCCFVSGLTVGNVNLKGLIFGLCAGLGYALYSVFARLALDRGYENGTINFYAMLIAALGAGIIWGFDEPVQRIFSSPSAFLWSLSTGLFSCFLPYLLYTYGLSGTEIGKAAVMASTEPVVATLVGIVLYQEKLTLSGALGVVFVVAAIVVLNTGTRKRNKAEDQSLQSG